MKRSLIIIFAVIAAQFVQAQSVDELFTAANGQYNNGCFDSALATYNLIIEREYESAMLYFNIGNTYYKKHNYPMSILYYEKALKLNPNSDDIKQNLAIANLHISDKIEPMPEIFLKRWWHSLTNVFTTDTWAIITVAMLAIVLGSLILFFKSHRRALRKTGFFAALITLIMFIISLIIAIQKYNYISNHDEAIVMTPTITVKSSPTATSVDLFVLHEGSKVSILDETGTWRKIRIANGSTGWLPEESMERF